MEDVNLELVEKLASQIFDAERDELEAKKAHDSYRGTDPATTKSLSVKATVAYAKAHNLRSRLYGAIHGERTK